MGVVERIFGHPRGGAGPPVECVLQGEISRGVTVKEAIGSAPACGVSGGGRCCGARMGAACLSWLQVQVHAGAYHGEVVMEEGLLWEEVTLRGGHGWVLAQVTVVGQGKGWPLSFGWPSLFLSVDSCRLHGHVTLKDLW